jgi:hypothetical protein
LPPKTAPPVIGATLLGARHYRRSTVIFNRQYRLPDIIAATLLPSIAATKTVIRHHIGAAIVAERIFGDYMPHCWRLLFSRQYCHIAGCRHYSPLSHLLLVIAFAVTLPLFAIICRHYLKANEFKMRSSADPRLESSRYAAAASRADILLAQMKDSICYELKEGPPVINPTAPPHTGATCHKSHQTIIGFGAILPPLSLHGYCRQRHAQTQSQPLSPVICYRSSLLLPLFSPRNICHIAAGYRFAAIAGCRLFAVYRYLPAISRHIGRLSLPLFAMMPAPPYRCNRRLRRWMICRHIAIAAAKSCRHRPDSRYDYAAYGAAIIAAGYFATAIEAPLRHDIKIAIIVARLLRRISRQPDCCHIRC